MKIIKILSFFLVVVISSCGSFENKVVVEELISKRDSLKRELQEGLKPSTDIKQFNWVYNAFAHAAVTGNESLFNVFVHPKRGLWIIHQDGAMLNFTKVMNISDYKNMQGRGLLPFDRDAMNDAPKNEALPVIDCDSKTLYSKEGCFSQMKNYFVEDKIWKNAGLDAVLDREVAEYAVTITRTVVNTKNYKYYFSLIEGSWYLTFIDIRRPCAA